MTLNSIYSLSFAVRKEKDLIGRAVGENIICAFVKNEPNIRFLSCQTRKYKYNNSNKSRNHEVWTILSSAIFAKNYKVPQENIPVDTVKEVTTELLSSLERCLSLNKGSLNSDNILDSRLQLGGAAVPLNVWSSKKEYINYDDQETKMSTKKDFMKEGFLYDAKHGVGACGDWLIDASLGGAWESGRRLALWLISTKEDGHAQQKESLDHEYSIGLPPDGSFRISKAAQDLGIGNVL